MYNELRFAGSQRINDKPPEKTNSKGKLNPMPLEEGRGGAVVAIAKKYLSGTFSTFIKSGIFSKFVKNFLESYKIDNPYLSQPYQYIGPRRGHED